MTARRRGGCARVAAGVAVLAATVACSGEDPTADPSPSSPPSESSSESSSPTPTPEPTATPAPAPGPLTIAVGRRHPLRGRAAGPARRPRDRAGPRHGDAGRRRSRDRQPRDVRRQRWPSRSQQAVHVPGAADSAFTALAAAGIDVATMANNHALDFGRGAVARHVRRHRRRVAGRPTARRGRAGPRRRRRVPAGARRGRRHGRGDHRRHRRRRRTPPPTRAGSGPPPPTRAGTADAIDPARLLRAVARGRPDGRRGRRLHALGHPGRAVPERGCSGPWPRTWSRRVPTSWSGAMPTGSRATGGSGRGYVAYGLGNYAWYTQSSEATSTTGVLTLTVQPAALRATDGRGHRRGVGACAYRHRRVAAADDPVCCSRLRGGPRRAARVRGTEVTDRAD